MATKCPNCGTENPDNAFYCGKCANELRASAAAPQVQEIELGQPRPFEEARYPPFASKEVIKQAREMRKALEDEMRARGIEIPVRVKVFAYAMVISIVAGMCLIAWSASLIHPWDKPVLPSYFSIVGVSMIVVAIALILLLVRFRSRKSAL
jgi:hypothetical protein